MWSCLGPLKTYLPVYLAGILVHFLVALVMARRLRLTWPVPILVSLSYLFGMIVGAKALFDIQRGIFSLSNLFSLDHYMRGGMWGGPLAYLVWAVPLVLVVSRSRPAAMDLIALATPIPLAIAKVACLCNACCYGKPSGLPWAVTFPAGDIPAPQGVPLHPTQIYEIVVLAVAGIVLYRMDRPRWRGTLLFWFLAVYGIGRSLTEMFRGDLAQQPCWGPFTQSQWLCAAASVVSVGILLAHRRRIQRNERPSSPPARQPAPAGYDCKAPSPSARPVEEESSGPIPPL
jgi:phosphatidylglycerol:prolipoprotein diacylglycerol transferase